MLSENSCAHRPLNISSPLHNQHVHPTVHVPHIVARMHPYPRHQSAYESAAAGRKPYMATGNVSRGIPGCISLCATHKPAAENSLRKCASVRVMDASERST
mmetsp:Transcript_22236/g.56790  ORF Transcript_22236/g.56790 Transcript_22236/m.56790 type:complete len:101 (+) Transcript_22236:193-495(+)